MSLTVAELVATLGIDTKGWDAQLTKSVGAATKELEKVPVEGRKAGEKTGDQLADGIEEGAKDAGKKAAGALEDAEPQMRKVGDDIGQHTGDALSGALGDATASVGDDLEDRLQANAAGLDERARVVGREAGKSVEDGVDTGAQGVGSGLGDEFKAQTADLPAKGRERGQETGEGVGEGVLDGMPDLSGGLGGLLDSALGGLPASVAGPAGAVGAAVGAAFMSGFSDAIANEAQADLIGERLSDLGGTSGEVAKVQAGLYRSAWGDSIESVGESIDHVYSTLAQGRGSEAELERLSRKAMAVAEVIGSDVPSIVSNAGVLMTTGLAKDADQAFDLITASAKRVPAGVRDELTEATHEYSQFFAGLGFSGEQTMGILVKAAEGGRYGLDKAGDAIKEFRIRATDMSKAVGDGYAILGLSQAEYTDKLLQGGDVAQRAYQEIVDAILSVEDPTQRSVAALALFGTPLEDISGDAAKMDEILRALATGGLPDAAGAADDAVDSFNNVDSAVTTMKRSVLGAFEDMANGMLDPFADAIKDAEGGPEKWAVAVGRRFADAAAEAIKLDPDTLTGIWGHLGLWDQQGEDAGKAWRDGFAEGVEGDLGPEDFTPEDRRDAAAKAPGVLTGLWASTGTGRTDWVDVSLGIDVYRTSARDAAVETRNLGGVMDDLATRAKPVGNLMEVAAVGVDSFSRALNDVPVASELSGLLSIHGAVKGLRETVGALPRDLSDAMDDLDGGMGEISDNARLALGNVTAVGAELREELVREYQFGGADAVRERSAEMVEDLRGVFAQVGITGARFDEYVALLGLTPESVETAIKVSGLDVAIAQVQLLYEMLGEATSDTLLPDGEFGRIGDAIAAAISEGDFESAKNLLTAFRDDMSDQSLDNPILLAINADPTLAVQALEDYKTAAAMALNITNLLADPSSADDTFAVWQGGVEGSLTTAPLAADTLIADSQWQAWKKSLESQGVKIPVSLEVSVHNAQGIIDRGGSGTPYNIGVLEFAEGRDKNGNGIIGRAGGGPIPDVGGRPVPGLAASDTVPLMGTPGEWVIQEPAVAKLGPDVMAMVNRGMLPAVPMPIDAGAALTAAPSTPDLSALESRLDRLAGALTGGGGATFNVTAPSPERAAKLVAREMRAVEWGRAN